VEVNRSKLRSFRSSAELREWFVKNHDKADELWIRFYKKGSGKKSVTYSDSIDEALCVGWIDGIRKSLDDISYTNRFTPRRPRSVWSNVNIGRVEKLISEGRMLPAGLAEYKKRDPDRSSIYSFERDSAAFSPDQEKKFRKNAKAWVWFESQSAYYRRLATWYVISAKKEETRDRRLDRLIADSAAGVKIGILGTPKK
jgi:uncharacterized protein YdeI (YjbR/CyaY-like superfamily)